MSEETSMLQEFARCAKPRLMAFMPTGRWIVGALTCVLIGSSALYAQDDLWKGPAGSSSWFTPGSWSLGQKPTGAQNAFVENGTTAQVDAVGATAATLTIDGGSTVQIMPGGSLQLTNPLMIGRQGRYLYTGGTVGGNFSWIDNGIVEEDATAGLAANISGTGRFIMDIPTVNGVNGTLFVSSIRNTYSGTTTLTSGTFQVDSAGALSPNSAFTVNSTLNLNGVSGTIGSLAGTGIVTNNGITLAILSVGADNTSTTFSGILKNG